MKSLDDLSPPLRQRVLWLDAEIRAGRYPDCEALARRFDVSRRTATYTLECMREELALPIGYSRRHRGYAYQGAPPPPLAPPSVGTLSAAELRALRLTLALGQRYLDSGNRGDLTAIHDRLLSGASLEVRQEAEAWRRQVVFTGPPPLPAPWLDRLYTAISRRQVLQIGYRAPSRRGETPRLIEPHFLVNAGGDWLLVAWDRFRNAVRTFAVARLARADPTGERFEPRTGFDAEQFTRHQFLSEGGQEAYTLRLRFSADLARVALERTWPGLEQRDELPDGTVELRLNTSGKEDVLRWILSFKDGVEVLEPEWMRHRVLEVARRLVARYSFRDGLQVGRSGDVE